LTANVFYFAYGSNADPDRFKSRVGEWRSRQRARLGGHKLRFARQVRSEGGGGAVVDASPGDHVHGVLFEITTEQLAAMDREEFDPSRDVVAVGRRVTGTVETADGPLEAEFYTVNDDGGTAAPSGRYLGHILRGLANAGYDETVLDTVRAAAHEASGVG
jgi:gamma-glutamylcyclotransferase (GGCT)/AIG2-like uncharacterized protein YtfP